MTDGNFSEGESIDDLLARMYGSEEIKSERLDPKEVQKEAKRLAQIQEEIGLWMDAQPPGYLEIKPGVKFSKSQFLGSPYIYTSGTRIFPGLGNGDVTFYASVHDSSVAYNHNDLKTRFRLTIALHTEESSREGAEQVPQNEKNHLATSYYFDNQGNFGKDVHIPVSLLTPDQFKDLSPIEKFTIQGHEKASFTKKGEMSSGDFELAGEALRIIQSFIAPPLSDS